MISNILMVSYWLVGCWHHLPDWTLASSIFNYSFINVTQHYSTKQKTRDRSLFSGLMTKGTNLWLRKCTRLSYSLFIKSANSDGQTILIYLFGRDMYAYHLLNIFDAYLEKIIVWVVKIELDQNVIIRILWLEWCSNFLNT